MCNRQAVRSHFAGRQLENERFTVSRVNVARDRVRSGIAGVAVIEIPLKAVQYGPRAGRAHGESYAHDFTKMTTRDHTMNMALTSAMLGELVVRSISLGAAVSLLILLLAALFSSSI